MEHGNDKKALASLKRMASGINEAQNSEVQLMQIVPGTPSDSCPAPAPTQSNNINVGNLSNVGSDVVTFDVVNGDVTAKTLIFGLGLVNRTGLPAFFKIANAAVDAPLVTDQFGAGTAKMEFFSEFSAGHSYIANSIKIFDISAAQASVAPAFATITPNGDLRETRAHNIERNVDLNYIVLANCHIPLTFFQGVTYVLGAGETISAEINVMAVDMIGNFGTGLGY